MDYKKILTMITIIMLLCGFFSNTNAYADVPQIDIHHIVYPEELVPVGTDFDISFILENIGGAKAYDVQLSVQAADEWMLSKSTANKTFPELNYDEPIECHFYFAASTEAINKNAIFEITIQYKESRDSDDVKTVTRYVGINIVNHELLQQELIEHNPIGLPKVIIKEYSYEPEKIDAGKSFTLNLTLYNTSETKRVENMSIVLSSEGLFLPLSSSDTLYVSSLGPNQEIEKSIIMEAASNLAPRSYPLTVSMNYDVMPLISTEALIAANFVENISLPVIQKPRLEIDSISFPYGQAQQGLPCDISVDFYNLGRTPIYNLKIEAVGDFEGEDLNYFLGSFDAGESDYFEASIISSRLGSLEGKVVFEFEDENGNTYREEKPFSVNVMPLEEPIIDASLMDENSDTRRDGTVVRLVIPICILFGMVIFIIIISKKKKGKRVQ